MRPDATVVVTHSEKEQAAATFKRTFGYHLIGVWCDNTTSPSLVLAGGQRRVEHERRSHRGPERGDRADPRHPPAQAC